MSRKDSQIRSAHQRKTPGLKDLSNKLSNVQIGTKRRFSTKSLSIDSLIESIKQKKYKRIVVLAGAGISTPSGIPDFRTPGTGLYDNLQRYNIPYPEAIFELNYFYRNPNPFFHLAKELYPGKYLPNIIHYFIRYLHEQNILHRVYTQNIDGLERMVGIPSEKIVEAHGTFLTATCLRCREKYLCEDIRQDIFDNQVPKCTKTARCTGVIKPDIVFFGEDLPRRFQLYLQDLPMSDLCIVMGTSLAVYPFADIVDSTARSTPRLLVNRQVVGSFLSPRVNDVTMIGDLELNVKQLLTKLEVIDQVVTTMKQENVEHEKNRKLISRPLTATTNTSKARLKAAETLLVQRREFSTSTNRRLQQRIAPQTKPVVNDWTKVMIEKHNDSLIFQRRRSKSAYPVGAERVSSSSSSSSTSSDSGSLNSSLSETDLSPFSFKPSSKSQIQSNPKPMSLAARRIKGNPLLTATLRTVI